MVKKVALNLNLTEKELSVLSDYSTEDLVFTSDNSCDKAKENICETLIKYINLFIAKYFEGDEPICYGFRMNNVVFEYCAILGCDCCKEHGSCDCEDCKPEKRYMEYATICTECAKKYNIPKERLSVCNYIDDCNVGLCSVKGCDNKSGYCINLKGIDNLMPVTIVFGRYSVPSLSILDEYTDYTSDNKMNIRLIMSSKEVAYLCSAVSAIFGINIKNTEDLVKIIHIMLYFVMGEKDGVSDNRLQNFLTDTIYAEDNDENIYPIPNKDSFCGDMELHYNGSVFDTFTADNNYEHSIEMCSECEKRIGEGEFIGEIRIDERIDEEKSEFVCGIKGCYNKATSFMRIKNTAEGLDIVLSETTE